MYIMDMTNTTNKIKIISNQITAFKINLIIQLHSHQINKDSLVMFLLALEKIFYIISEIINEKQF